LSIELELKTQPKEVASSAHTPHTAAEGGDIALKAVDGATGKVRPHFKTLDNGTAITYQALLGFDGYITKCRQISCPCCKATLDKTTLPAYKVYPLGKRCCGIDGTATFTKE
jgi:hypothetical protein